MQRDKKPRKRTTRTKNNELSIKIKTSEISINLKSLNTMNEAEISDKITTLLFKYGITPYQQHPIPSKQNTKKIGSCDLYIYDKRTIIEVKKIKRLDKGPYDPDSGDNGRSAFDQLSNYIKAERSHTNSRILDFVDETDESTKSYHWIGIVTNYKKWWAWTWPQSESNEDDGRPQDSFNGVELTEPKERQLIAFLQRKDTKPVPKELGPIFELHKIRFMKLYERLKDYRDTHTQKGLWLKQLEASGNAPYTDINDMFVGHTLLILITRLISKAVGGHDINVLTQGFVSWVGEDSDEIKSLIADIESYDWSHETRDIMRGFYMESIPKKHRKRYGEYYTPDWLAEKLAMTVIDEKYIKEQLESFQSNEIVKPILDPACGSGSLLYHAGRIILKSDAVTEARQYMNPAKINEFLCSMLYGIDIHPVAVEMTKTNIHRLIHYASDQQIQVYQGDSLLLDRPTSNIHSSIIADPNDLILYSPKGIPLILPRSFLKSPESIEILTRTAKENITPPKLLIKSLNKKDSKKVTNAHKTLTEIIDKEGNSVWEWYIKNQAAPLLLQERKAGRIISNPPWVRTNQISSKDRKILVESEAKNLNLWVGGNNATSFDIAALFVHVCSTLYLTNPKKSGWILIGGALKAKAWKGLHNSKIWKDYTAMWDLGNIAFDMGFSTCVVFLGVNTPNKKLTKEPNTSVKSNEFLSDIQNKTKWVNPDAVFNKLKSGYIVGKKAIPKNGATLFPYNFVRIKEIISTKNGKIKFITVVAKGRWERYGSLSDVVPKRWVKDCIFSQDIYPYTLQTLTKTIIPMTGKKWDKNLNSEPYWKKVSDFYKGNPNLGKTSPKTLQDNLDHQKKLTNQLWNEKWLVVYNAGGDNHFAMKVIPKKYIIEHGCFYIPCESEDEADYLTAVLNSDIMKLPIKNAKTSELYFGLAVWKNVPIPRFISKNENHIKLVNMAKMAGKISDEICKTERSNGNRSCNFTLSRIVMDKLRQSGLTKQINDVCKTVIDEYYESNAGKSYWN